MTLKWNSAAQAAGFMNSARTLVIFSLSCIAFAFMGVFYFVVNFIRNSWLNFLEKRFPELEFVKKSTLRSVVDTHRNMGIITILATINGTCDPYFIKKRLMEDILEKRRNDGRYSYRHLRRILTTRWGWYAWQKPAFFNIDNHLVFASPFYRGRAISDANLQEYISETVSKYLVPDLPPWQITVFQLLNVEKYYMLIRFHHMLLSNEGMDLGSLFSAAKKPNGISKRKPNVGDCNDDSDCDDDDNNDDNDDEANMEGDDADEEDTLFLTSRKVRRSNPFQELYKAPKAIPALIEQINESFANSWNEFLSIYDPTENPLILKNPGLKATLAMFAIVIIGITKRLIFNPCLCVKIINNGLAQKGLTWSFFLWRLYKTLNPLSVTFNLARFGVKIFIIFLKLPLFFACELRSLMMIGEEGYGDASYVKTIIVLWTTVRDSLKEAIYYLKMFYNGPRVVLEEFLSASNCSSHQLQFVSLCGRKVVSWSRGFPVEKIFEIEDVTGASMSEILITATSASLRDFLMQYSLEMPDTLTTTARFYPQEQLINKILSPCGSGILCLPLPIKNPFGHEYDPVTELRAVQQIVLRARLKQPALYLASLSQLDYGMLTQVMPSPILRIVLNLLSRKFPVILSEVAPSKIEEGKKHYLWGQEVENLMYWKPPQANICMSLTLMTFGNYVTLGVMADALLSPHHSVITDTFAQHIWELATAAGVATDFGNYSLVSDDSDTPNVTRTLSNSSLSSSSLDLDGDENNLNRNESSGKYPLQKKLQFNIPY